MPQSVESAIFSEYIGTDVVLHTAAIVPSSKEVGLEAWWPAIALRFLIAHMRMTLIGQYAGTDTKAVRVGALALTRRASFVLLWRCLSLKIPSEDTLGRAGDDGLATKPQQVA